MVLKNIGHVEGAEAIDALSRYERIVDLKLKIQVLEGDYSTMKTELDVEGELSVESTDLLKLRCDNLQLSHTVTTYGNDPMIQGLLRRFDAIYEFFGW